MSQAFVFNSPVWDVDPIFIEKKGRAVKKSSRYDQVSNFIRLTYVSFDLVGDSMREVAALTNRLSQEFFDSIEAYLNVSREREEKLKHLAANLF